MLLRVRAENFLSIRDPEELNLTASSLKDSEDGLIDCGTASGRRAVPAAVIYGANASGKSNFLEAIKFVRRAVCYSHSRGEPGDAIPREPFRLDEEAPAKPSVFDADFVLGKVRYHYGFEVTDKAFHAEWLYSFPYGRQRTLFEREQQDFSFGRELPGRNKVIADLTRPNSLFLSAAAQNDHEVLTPIRGFFASIGHASSNELPPPVLAERLKDKTLQDRAAEFLEKVNTGVVGMRMNEIDTPHEMRTFQKAFTSALQAMGQDSPEIAPDDDDKIKVVELAHKGSGGKHHFLKLDSESAGTKKLLANLPAVFRALDRGSVVLIDELDSSLHTQACEAILSLFSSKRTNPRGAQLIATTHDTNILRSQFLRRDQVWFTEKDEEGATHLFPLTDFRLRKGDNLAKGYLQGRFGAVPFSGPVPRLTGTD